MNEIEPATERNDGPHIRWGAIVWGIVVATVGSIVLAILPSAGGRDAAVEWLGSLNPISAGLIALLLLGVTVLIGGALAAVGRRRKREGSAPTGDDVTV